jgi:murein DD-endopeptidase MepM/ murein hydrolase activator NlpD
LASVHEYKRFENSIVQKVKSSASFIVSGIGAFFCGLGRALTRPYTVVLVPHSEKKIYNLHINVFSIILFFLILTGTIGVVFHYTTANSPGRGSLTDKDNFLKNTQASLDELRDEVALLLKEAIIFEPALLNTLSTIKKDITGLNNSGVISAGDISTFFGSSNRNGVIQEIEDIRRLRGYLAAAADPIRELEGVLNSQGALLTEIPSIWPVKNGMGRITMHFGPNKDPFTGQYYIHKGIDIANNRQGDPIVAAADGQVVNVEYEQGGLGHNVVIRHKHGFYTRYAHMLSFRVRTGDRVQQGDVIGYIGNTGLSTGPHLHYEIHIGSDVVDPYKYISMRKTISKTPR